MSTTIHDIFAEFREAAHSKRDMGDKFERLSASLFVTELGAVDAAFPNQHNALSRSRSRRVTTH